MAYVWADRVLETSTTTGTGPLALAGAVTKNRTFASVCSVADTLPYAIINLDANEWEVGLGTYSAANELTRTTVQASSNAGAAVNFSAGTKRVGLATTAGSLVPSTGGTMTGTLSISAGSFYLGATSGFVTRFGTTNVTPNSQIQSTGAAASFLMARFSNDGSPGRIFFTKSRSGSLGGHGVINTTDELGGIAFAGSDGTKMLHGATIVVKADGTLGADYVPSRITLQTSNGTGAPASNFSVGPTGFICVGASDSEVVIDADRLFRLRQYTVATLPTVGTAGRLAAVTDASAPTYNATIAGGGAVNVPVYDNGTNWVAH